MWTRLSERNVALSLNRFFFILYIWERISIHLSQVSFVSFQLRQFLVPPLVSSCSRQRESKDKEEEEEGGGMEQCHRQACDRYLRHGKNGGTGSFKGTHIAKLILKVFQGGAGLKRLLCSLTDSPGWWKKSHCEELRRIEQSLVSFPNSLCSEDLTKPSMLSKNFGLSFCLASSSPP